MRRMELEQEYEKKKLQLELDTPKRFAQGEWVSGKTLTEIIRTLTAGKKEDYYNEILSRTVDMDGNKITFTTTD